MEIYRDLVREMIEVDETTTNKVVNIALDYFKLSEECL
jgi:hypothetical protein